MNFKIIPYKTGSTSAKMLAEGLGIKRVKLNNTKIRKLDDKVFINWGCSSRFPFPLLEGTMLNRPECVGRAANKLKSFKAFDLHTVPTAPYTEDIEVAKGWIEDGYKAVCRTKLTGNSGQGIVVASSLDELVEAKLYTKYMKKKYEYRVHIGLTTEGDHDVIDTQRKARDTDVADEDVNWEIRNHSNGFIFARNEDHVVPDDVIEAAKKAVTALGLDFGAVDVGWNEHRGEAYVYEVNTACGLTGTTLENYINYFNEWRNYYA